LSRLKFLKKFFEEIKTMTMIKYDPFRELRGLQEEVNRLFSAGLTRSGGQEEIVQGAWVPSVDVIEGKEAIVLEADLPGMSIDDVDVSIENNMVTIRGERKFEKRDETDNVHRVERSFGSFTRSFVLPRNVAAEGATAAYENGILRVSLPKKEEAKARKIEIAGNAAAKAVKA
jgi:HSP20 family protein